MTKKNIIIFIIIIAIIAIIVVASSILSKNPEEVEPETIPESVEIVTLQPTEMETEKREETYYSIDLEYPKARPNELAEVRDYVDMVRSDFMALVPKTAQEAEDQGFGEDRTLVLKMETTVYTSSTTVTYKLETYMFTGGAHGGTFISTFTYDKAGKLLLLKDILSSPDALEKLSARARNYFYNKLGSQGQREIINIGTEPKEENWSAWYATDKSVTFIFQQYQIGPYAIGIQEFPLSRAEAKTLLNI
jgi:hypothetical protein